MPQIVISRECMDAIAAEALRSGTSTFGGANPTEGNGFVIDVDDAVFRAIEDARDPFESRSDVILRIVRA